jgi:hypothetical protein
VTSVERAATVADPAVEVRMTALHATRGANYWSRLPVTRMDVFIGAYEDISSADVPGVTASLVGAMPSLIEHRCSIEHVALELQALIGHQVGYGRTRGGDQHGEYTIVIEHVSDVVGMRAAALALDIVQRAFAGTLDSVDSAVAELRALATHPATEPLRARVVCAITGSAFRGETRAELARLGVGTDDDLVVDVAPGYILQAGLPYAHSDIAIVLDDTPTDVPERYRDPERASRLVSVVADAVGTNGIVIAPASAWDVQDRARDVGCRVAVFATDDRITQRDKKVAFAAAWVDGRRIVIEHGATLEPVGDLRDDAPPAAQVAAALCAWGLHEVATPPLPGHSDPA